LGLLEDKENRLSSLIYKRNDIVPQSYGCRAARQSQNVAVVFPDDAADIKAHAWFSNINWAAHHLTCPPFIPQVHDDVTTYFEKEESIIRSNDVTDTSSSDEGCTN
jgi:hypothetical protein